MMSNHASTDSGVSGSADSGGGEAGRPAGPNWPHVGLFLGLTFGLAWLLDLGIYLHGGLTAPGTVVALQLQMLLPALSATLLGTFVFRESPIHRATDAGRGRWLFRFMLLLTAAYAAAVAVIWLAPGTPVVVATAGFAQGLTVLGFVLLVVLRAVAGRSEMARLGLAWGRARYYLLIGLGIIAFYVLQAVLNGIFGLGPTHFAPIKAPPGLGPQMARVIAGVQSVVVAPFLFLLLAFGEEYGWRGYLQSELTKLGRVRGILLLGAIWGAWHWPLILMGFSYPGYPIVGMLLALLFLMGFAVVLGFAVLSTGSIILAAYLHALNDQTTAYLVFLGFKPDNPVFSFGVGIYGVATLALVALLLLRGRVWRVGLAARRE